MSLKLVFTIFCFVAVESITVLYGLFVDLHADLIKEHNYGLFVIHELFGVRSFDIVRHI